MKTSSQNISLLHKKLSKLNYVLSSKLSSSFLQPILDEIFRKLFSSKYVIALSKQMIAKVFCLKILAHISQFDLSHKFSLIF